MTPQTKFHRHWYVKVRYGSRVYRLLKKPLITLDWTNSSYVHRSRLTWGIVMDGLEQRYVLTSLSLLHSFTGLTIKVK